MSGGGYVLEPTKTCLDLLSLGSLGSFCGKRVTESGQQG